MKQLPKYFVIQRDEDNPLWDKYIEWLNNTYNRSLGGNVHTYYGHDGSDDYFYDNIKEFRNNPTLITLEQWDKIINPKEYKLEDNEIQVGDYVKITNSGSCYTNDVQAQSMGATSYTNNTLLVGEINKVIAIDTQWIKGKIVYLLEDIYGKHRLYSDQGLKKYIGILPGKNYTVGNTLSGVNKFNDDFVYVDKEKDIQTGTKFQDALYDTMQNTKYVPLNNTYINNNKPMNKLQEALVEQFVSTKSNVKAMETVTNKSKLLVNMLDDIGATVGKVRSKVEMFRRDFLDAIEDSDIKTLEKQIDQFKEIDEYLTNFLDNKLKDLSETKETKFDVQEFFK